MARVVSYDNGVPLIELFDTNGEQVGRERREKIHRDGDMEDGNRGW